MHNTRLASLRPSHALVHWLQAKIDDQKWNRT